MGFWRGDLIYQPLQALTGTHSAPHPLTHRGSKTPSPSLVVFQNAHLKLQGLGDGQTCPGDQFVLLGDLHWLHSACVTWVDDR